MKDVFLNIFSEKKLNLQRKDIRYFLLIFLLIKTALLLKNSL